MPSQTEEPRAQRLARRYLNDLRDRINESARLVERLGNEIVVATTARDQHAEVNVQLTQQEAGRVGVHILILLCFVSGYLLDCMLFAAPVEFLCSMLNWPGWAQMLAQFAAPLAMLAFEAFIAFLRFNAQEEAEYGGRGPVLFWTALGILPAIVAVGFAVATHLATTEHAALTPGFIVLRIALGAWASIIHLVVLLSGGHQHAAKAYLIFIIQQRKLRRVVVQLTRESDQVVNMLNVAFANYLQGLNAYNNAYPTARIDAGPFNLVAREQLRSLFGPEVIQDPQASQGNTASAAASASSQGTPINQVAPGSGDETSTTQTPTEPRPANGSGEEEYLRTILTRTVRERDSEVQP